MLLQTLHARPKDADSRLRDRLLMGVDLRAFNDRRVGRCTAAPTKRATGLTNVAPYLAIMGGSESRSAAGTRVA